jgi:WD40 repeat protein
LVEKGIEPPWNPDVISKFGDANVVASTKVNPQRPISTPDVAATLPNRPALTEKPANTPPQIDGNTPAQLESPVITADRRTNETQERSAQPDKVTTDWIASFGLNSSQSDIKTIPRVEVFATLQSKEPYCCSPVAISDDGRWAAGAAGGADYDPKKIVIWDIANAKLTSSIAAHSEHIDFLAFDKAGKLLLSGGYDGTAKLWNVEDGRRLKTFNNIDPADSGAISPNSMKVAIGNRWGNIKVWDIGGNAGPSKFVPKGNGWDTTIAYSSDGTKILQAWGGGKNELSFHVLDLSRQKYVEDHDLSAENSNPQFIEFVTAIADAGENVAVLGFQGGVALLDTKTGKILSKVVVAESISAVSPHFAIVADKSGRAVALNVTPTGIKSISSLLVGQPAANLLSVGIARSGTWAIAGDGKDVRIWALQQKTAPSSRR